MSTSFASMNLVPQLVAACRKQGFTEATPIQSLVIPAVQRGADVMVEASTGSGKTLAYGLPILNGPFSQDAYPEALILAPTRELAEQIGAVLQRTAGTLVRRVVVLTGRGGLVRQQEELAQGAHIVVGTLGRVEELLAMKRLVLEHVRTLVLDEVDELLLGGASANVATLLNAMPKSRQMLLFSATMPASVEDLARRVMREPERLRLSAARELPASLTHWVMRTTVRGRLDDLVSFLDTHRPYQSLLFCGTRKEVDEVCEALQERGVEAKALHGELSAVKRRRLVEEFRSGNLPVLVASDLAARGLDLPGVDVVINFSLPETAAAYLHRAGRTARAGKSGVVVSMLIEQQHARYVQLKEKYPLQVVDVRGDKMVARTPKTREERDLQYRKLPKRLPAAAGEPSRGGEEPTPVRPSARAVRHARRR